MSNASMRQTVKSSKKEEGDVAHVPQLQPHHPNHPSRKAEEAETQRWLESLEHLLQHVFSSKESIRVPLLFNTLIQKLRESGISVPATVNTPYINTIPVVEEPAYPGNREIERRIKNYLMNAVLTLKDMPVERSAMLTLHDIAPRLEDTDVRSQQAFDIAADLLFRLPTL